MGGSRRAAHHGDPDVGRITHVNAHTAALPSRWDGMSAMTVTEPEARTGLALVPPAAPEVVVPCVARPSTRYVHRDGPCRCFAGGPAPEFPASTDPARASLTVAR